MASEGTFRFPRGADAAAFLARNWQRRALVCRRALDPRPWVIDPDDLVAIAMEDEADARLVTRRGSRWQVRDGPLSEGDLDGLPERAWTLLVQAVEVWEPRYHGLLDLFAFLPRWRFDDVMISLASRDGGVGPHVDQYDVFLVQLTGRRRWRWGGPPAPPVETAPLRLMSAFAPRHEAVLEAGDALYLPPGVPHEGVALDDGCLTASIGFRAPGAVDLADRFAELALARWSGDAETEPRFGDPGRPEVDADGERIGADDLARARAVLTRALDDDDLVACLLGEQATLPRLAPHAGRGIKPASLLERLDKGAHLERWAGSRLAWAPRGRGRGLLFADGESHSCRASFARWLSGRERIDARGLAAHRDDAEAMAVLAALVAQGTFGFVARR